MEEEEVAEGAASWPGLDTRFAVRLQASEGRFLAVFPTKHRAAPPGLRPLFGCGPHENSPVQVKGCNLRIVPLKV